MGASVRAVDRSRRRSKLTHADTPAWQWSLLLIAVACGLLALRGVTTKPLATEPGKVNCAQGSLMEVSVAVTTSSVVARNYVLGSSQVVNFPHHWLRFVRLGEAQAEMDVRLDDQKVLRYRHLSVDEEQRRFPRVTWGHHLLLGCLGAILMLGIWATSEDLSADWQTLRAWSFSGSGRFDVLADGRMVDFTTTVRCGLGHTIENIVDCSLLHLDDKASDVVLAPPKSGLVEWAQGRGLNLMHDMSGGAVWRLHSGDTHMLSMLPVIIRDVPKLIDDVDVLCSGATEPDAAQECHYIKADLAAALQTDGAGTPNETHWDGARAWVKKQASSNVEVHAVMFDSELQRWTARAKAVADAQLRTHVMALLDDASLRQREGVSVKLTSALDIQGDAAIPTDGLSAWRALQQWASTAEHRTVKIKGFVTDRDDDNGQVRWTVDNRLKSEEAWRSGVRCLLMVGAMALLAWHLPAWWFALRKDQRRLDAAIEYWSNVADKKQSESSETGERWRKAS